jgi:glyoxylase-like metal-dependent hydrolase (beta-lactamase superfamily II)
MTRIFAALGTLLFASVTWADQNIPDKYPDSVLYDAPREVITGVWSAIGATAPPTYENSGHNNNLSFIITSEGVVVVNAGACYQLARALYEEIRRITDQPVRYVILENGQGHAALGSNYWQEQGVPVIAHVDAAEEIEEGAYGLLSSMQTYNRDKAEGTEVVLPDITFEDQYVIELGGMRIEALYLGPGHSPGDIQVWLPEQKLVISGDMAFHQRLLPIFEYTDTKAWLETYEDFLALEPEIVIPGHGVPTTIDVVTRYTRDYLVFLRGQVQILLDEGGTLADAYEIDQSAYSHLDTYEELAARNAGMVFEAMEFE